MKIESDRKTIINNNCVQEQDRKIRPRFKDLQRPRLGTSLTLG